MPLTKSHFTVLLAAAVAGVIGLSACSSDFQGGFPGEDESGVTIVGKLGRQPGQFVKPRAVALTKDDQLLVIDRSGRIQRFDSISGEYQSKWQLQEFSNGTPTGMTIDPRDGTIWLADTHYQRIVHYDHEGNILFQFGKHGTNPGEMIFPTDVCPDPADGSLWICEYGLRSRIMHYSATGEFLGEWGSGEYEYTELQRPMAITVTNDGRIFVADGGNHRILIYNRKGELLDSWGEAGEAPGQIKYPYDLAFDNEGMIFICEYGNSRVSRFTSTGEFLGMWGVPGHDPGELFSPWGVAVGPDGRMAIADTNNGRVQLIAHPEELFRKENEV